MEIILKSVALTGIIWGFYKLVLHKNTFFQWNRLFLLSGIILSLALPFLVIPVEVIVESANNVWQNTATVVDKNTNSMDKSHWDFNQILLVLYSLGLIVVFFKILIQSFSLIRFVKNLPKRKENKLTIHETDRPINAFSFFKTVVVNTNTFSTQEQALFLVHESVHAHQYHTVDILLSQILILVQWFNPFAWWYKKSIETNLEYIADRDSQHIIGNEKEYQQLLLKTTVSSYKSSITNRFNSSLIKNRIKMLHTPQTKPIQKWKFLLLLPILALFIYSFNRVEVQKFEISTLNPIDVSFSITKESTDADFNAIKEIFKSQDITFEISQLKRNDLNEITGLSIQISSKDFQTNFNSESSTPIEPISINYNSKLKKVHIGNIMPPPPPGHLMFIDEKMGNDPLHKNMQWEEKGNEEKVFIIKSDQDGGSPKNVKHITIIRNDSLNGNEKTFEWVEKDGEEKEIKQGIFVKKIEIIDDGGKVEKGDQSSDKEKQYTIIIKEDDNGNITYKVNGKEVSKEELDQIDTNEIKEVNVIKKKEIKKTK